MNIKHLQKLLIFMTLGSIAPVKALFTERSGGLLAHALQRAYAQKPQPVLEAPQPVVQALQKEPITEQNVGELFKDLPGNLQILTQNYVLEDREQLTPAWFTQRVVPNVLDNTDFIISQIKLSDGRILCSYLKLDKIFQILNGLHNLHNDFQALCNAIRNTTKSQTRIFDIKTGEVITQDKSHIVGGFIEINAHTVASLSLAIVDIGEMNGNISFNMPIHICIWDINEDGMYLKKKFPLQGAIAITKFDDNHIVVLLCNGAIKIINLFGDPVGTVYGAQEEHIPVIWTSELMKQYASKFITKSIFKSYDNLLITSAGKDKKILNLWSMNYNDKRVPILGHISTCYAPAPIKSITQISPTTIAYCTDNNSIAVHDIGSGECLQTIEKIFKNSDKPCEVALLKDNNAVQRLICISGHGNFKIWDINPDHRIDTRPVWPVYCYEENDETIWQDVENNYSALFKSNFSGTFHTDTISTSILSDSHWLISSSNKMILCSINSHAIKQIDTLTPGRRLQLHRLVDHTKKITQKPQNQRQLTPELESVMRVMPKAIKENLTISVGLGKPIIPAIVHPVNPNLWKWDTFVLLCSAFHCHSGYKIYKSYKSGIHHKSDLLFSIALTLGQAAIYRYILRPRIYYA